MGDLWCAAIQMEYGGRLRVEVVFLMGIFLIRALLSLFACFLFHQRRSVLQHFEFIQSFSTRLSYITEMVFIV